MGENPIVYVGIFAAVAFGIVVAVSALVGISVAVAGRIVGNRNEKKYQMELRAMLPGLDCGQCGCESCDAYAKAVYYGVVSEDACVHGEEGLREALLECVNRLHKDLEDPAPIKPKEERILGIWDKKR